MEAEKSGEEIREDRERIRVKGLRNKANGGGGDGEEEGK